MKDKKREMERSLEMVLRDAGILKSIGQRYTELGGERFVVPQFSSGGGK